MAQLAIKGHPTRGKEVIEILEMLGGVNIGDINGRNSLLSYYIDEYGGIEYINNCNPDEAMVIFTLEEFLKNYPYKVGDKVYNIIHNENQIITKISWDSQENEVIYQTNNNEFVYVNYLQPYKKEIMEGKPDLLQRLKEYFENTPREVIEKGWHEYDKYNEIGPSVDEYLEYVSSIRQPKYPTTYEECCKVLCCKPIVGFAGLDDDEENLYGNFIALKRCRDAYLKIAGDEMGLGKPWEPDYTNPDIDLYVIINIYNRIEKAKYGYGFQQCILTFPTEEMRDAFYENFKKLIEQCKELL